MIKIIIIILVIILIFLISKLLLSINLNLSNEKLIYYILEDSNYYLYNDYHKFNEIFKGIYHIDINNPKTLLTNTSYYMFNKKVNSNIVYNDNHIEEVVIDKSPLVYIYSTHPTESFKNTEISAYNIDPNIKEVSYILKDKLEEIGVNTIVEQGDVTSFLKEHNYNYNQSYTASLYYLKQFYDSHPNVKLIIDLHRDGVDYDYSVTTINGKKYAKVMLVVGLNHNNYQIHLDISNKINDILKKKYPSITRGIFTNKTAVFNQDFTNNMILIELGGNNNELVEVLNTVDILAEAIKEYIYEN